MPNRLIKIKLYCFSLFSDLFFVFAVDKIIFKASGFSVTQIAIIVSVWGGLQLLAEIPTGVLSINKPTERKK